MATSNKTVFYKLRHKPTGLFYQPIKGRWKEDKTNLAVNGKVYSHRRPQYERQPVHIYVSSHLVKKYNIDAEETSYGNRLQVPFSDLEWVEYETKETDVIQYGEENK